jgi:hypothetical protein
MNWQDIPVFIINRNRLTNLRQLVGWLLESGTRQIGIFDNASEYPPLLQYYRSLPSNVLVTYCGDNCGPYAFWATGACRCINTPYVVTDSDIVPAAFCPRDLIAYLYRVLCQYPDAGKVGPALRVDNLTAEHSAFTDVNRWEYQNWQRPIAKGLFAAPLDTTFALYVPNRPFSRLDKTNIRTGYPYICEHTPWYVNEQAPDPEQKFFSQHASHEFSNWSVGKELKEIRATSIFKDYEKRKRLAHVGGGNEYIPGWINIDKAGRKLDVQCDLDHCVPHALPFADSSLDGFYLCNCPKQLDSTLALLKELYRTARSDAILHMRLPYESGSETSGEMQVKTYFEDLFVCGSGSPSGSAGYEGCGGWQHESTLLIVDKFDKCLLSLGAPKAGEIIRSRRNQVRELVVELVAVKPSNGRLAGETKRGPIQVTSDPRVIPSFCLPPDKGAAAEMPGLPLSPLPTPVRLAQQLHPSTVEAAGNRPAATDLAGGAGPGTAPFASAPEGVKLSIVMPTNRTGLSAWARILDACSCANDQVEVIVRDNSGDPRKADAISRLSGRNCRVIVAEPCGALENSEQAAGLAKGDFIFLVADDDLLPQLAIPPILKAIGRYSQDMSVAGITGDYIVQWSRKTTLVRYPPLDAAAAAQRIAPFLEARLNVFFYSVARRQIIHDVVLSFVRSLPFHFVFTDWLAALLYLASGRFVGIERALYHPDIRNWDSEASFGICLRSYQQCGLDGSALRLQCLLQAFEGAKIVLGKYPGLDLSPDERQAVAALWFRHWHAEFCKSLNWTDPAARFDQQAAALCRKWSQITDISLEHLLTDLAEYFSLSNPEGAQKYFNFWAG